MKNSNSTMGKLDVQNLKDITKAVIIGALSIYVANTEIINKMIGENLSQETSVIIIMVLAYASKKVLTDYSK